MGKGRVLKIYDSKAVFENLDGNSSSCLFVTQGKDSGQREFAVKEKSQLPELGASPQILPFESIFGFYDLLSGSYVALVVESEPFVDLPILQLRKAKKILVVPLFRNGRLLSEVKQQDEDRYLQLLHLGFSEHNFYYSYTHDMTLTQQRQARLTAKQLTEPLWSRADLRFFWNRDLLDELVLIKADDWIVPFMSAFVESRMDCQIDDLTVSLTLISRRSRFRQGCRFIKRGIDENGCVANFAETEQILVFPDGKVTSYVQIRGSIPVKWMSPVHMRYEPNVFIDNDANKSIEYCNKHITELIEKYSDNNNNATILMVNLVDNKKDQGRLGVAYKETIDAVAKQTTQSLVYHWFDFHHETKQKGKWNNLSKLIIDVNVSDAFKDIKYFAKAGNGTVLSWQKGVIRTNCMDNLDRTNVIQTLFARRSLILQVNKQNTLEMNGVHILQTPWKSFEVIFKSMWTNNANAMSLGYSGTGALKADFTKTGKRTIKGAINDGINSCMRYYINNFTDGVKQDAIDLMIGRYRPDPFGTTPFTEKSSQYSLASNFTKAFVLLMIVFTTFVLLIPPVAPLGGGQESHVEVLERNIKHLQMHFFLALAVTLVILMYLAYKVVKKGAKIGEYMVVHPELCPEPLPPGRG